MTQKQFKTLIRNVPDFPKKGIQFKDITTALKNAECLRWIRDKVTEMYRDKGITQVVGLESRGFIIGPAVAMELGAGFVLARKPGKLPADVISASYNKEYGTDTIQLHSDALNENDIVLIHDDLLATGGSIEGAIRLVRKAGVKKIYVNFLIELSELNGRKNIDSDIEVTSLVQL
ncbi:MAG: adenine phosphoribosyltransferase [Paludibacteraceae bacterium]|nr:adenine phosphoribosyltransferase [Paludibacteraceae bacterium]